MRVCIIKVVGPSLHEASLSTGVNPLLCTEVSNPPSAAPESLLEDSLMHVWVCFGSASLANFLVDCEISHNK